MSYNFTVKKGDTFNGVTFQISVNGTDLDLTDATLLCQFKKNPLSDPALELSIGHGITVTSAATGTFRIDPQVINIASGVYRYDVQTTLLSGVIKTYVDGEMTVTQDISEPTS